METQSNLSIEMFQSRTTNHQVQCSPDIQYSPNQLAVRPKTQTNQFSP